VSKVSNRIDTFKNCPIKEKFKPKFNQ